MSSTFSPQIVTVNFQGWDTHFTAGPNTGNLASKIQSLGKSLKDFRSQFTKAEWNDIVVVVMSEFGRTVKSNPSAGMDHGAGSMMMVLGGQVNTNHKRSKMGWDLTGFEDTEGIVSASEAGSSSALKREVDYRLVMAEIIHRHLGIGPADPVDNFDKKVSTVFADGYVPSVSQYLNILKQKG
jgi:uncharacterized protein (DUF1501 family)